MAYSTSAPLALVAQRVGASAGAIWIYSSTDDKVAVTAADYVSDGFDLGLKAGDIVHHIDSTNLKINTLIASTVTTDGAATLSDATSQELLATGAVTPGVSSIELNHASTIIAATIATSLDHQGLFVIKDTSASGTAAHTLTVTVGTLDGTNSIVTLNAPDEALIVWFDSAGDGTIIENVGTVVLS